MLHRKFALLSTCSAFAFTVFLPATIFLVPSQALAACTTTGSSTVCTSTAPAVWTATVGTGRSDNNRSVDVQSGAGINTNNAPAISIGDAGRSMFVMAQVSQTTPHHPVRAHSAPVPTPSSSAATDG